jgi:hypothetical protein
MSREEVFEADSAEIEVVRYRGELSYPNRLLVPDLTLVHETNDSTELRGGELGLSSTRPFPVRASAKRGETRDPSGNLRSVFHVFGFALERVEWGGLMARLTFHFLDKRYEQGDLGRERNSLLGLDWRYRFGTSELRGVHRINGDRIRRKEERFYYVGEGQGSHSYDPASGRYYPDPFGSYKREIVILEDEGSGLFRDHQVGGTLRREGLLDLEFDLRLKERRGTPFPPVYSFTERGLVFRDLDIHTVVTFDLGEGSVTPFASYRLGRVRDLELETRKSLRDRDEVEAGAVVPLSDVDLTLGGRLEYRREGYEDLPDRERVSGRRVYARIRWPLGPVLSWTLEGSFENHDIDELIFGEEERIRLDVYGLRPGLSGQVLPGWSLNLNVGLAYGRADQTPPDILYLTFPVGRFVDYRLNLRRTVSESLTLSLDIRGEAGEHRRRRERLTLSARADF